jgi:hypothetical protein
MAEKKDKEAGRRVRRRRTVIGQKDASSSWSTSNLLNSFEKYYTSMSCMVPFLLNSTEESDSSTSRFRTS